MWYKRDRILGLFDGIAVVGDVDGTLAELIILSSLLEVNQYKNKWIWH